MKIDLTISWDDLSKECKMKIKELETLGFEVELHYPELTKKPATNYDWTYAPSIVNSPTPPWTIASTTSDGKKQCDPNIVYCSATTAVDQILNQTKNVEAKA